MAVAERALRYQYSVAAWKAGDVEADEPFSAGGWVMMRATAGIELHEAVCPIGRSGRPEQSGMGNFYQVGTFSLW